MTSTFFELNYSQIAEPLAFFNKEGLTIPESLNKAINKRKIDFLAGRYCAKKALSNHLMQEWLNEIPIGPTRAPIWPPNILGSITHTKDFAAALISTQDHYLGIGLDAEIMIQDPKPGLEKQICAKGELGPWLKREFSYEELLTLVFSAKETLYKCIHPTEQIFFGFHDARLTNITSKVVRLELCTDVGKFPKGFSLDISYEKRVNMLLTTGFIKENDLY